MKCPTCGAAALLPATRDVPYVVEGQTTVLPAVTGEFCSACGEQVLGARQQAQQALAERAAKWMQDNLMHSVAEALKSAWILDCDTRINPCMPTKPGPMWPTTRTGRDDPVMPFTRAGSATCAWCSTRSWSLDLWSDVGQGWMGREDTLRLVGWRKPSALS